SDELGNVDLASEYARLSTETKQRIENEVRRLVEDGRDRALKLLTENRDGLKRLAEALVEYETLSKEEMETVVKGGKLTEKLKADPDTPVKAPEAEDLLPPGGLGLPPSLGGSPPSGEQGAQGEGANGRPYPVGNRRNER
ncbi:hypothetical protein KC368_g6415, partial [Hortaea werneckii]